jgi:hypothetical protein
MPMILVEDLREFAERHGGEANMVKDVDRSDMGIAPVWYLPDGATVRNGLNGADFYEPPTDRKELASKKLTYHRLLLKPAEDAFRACKRSILDHGPLFRWDEKTLRCPPPPYHPDAFTREEAVLNKLKDLVMGHRAAIAALEQEIDNLPETIAAKERAEQRRKALDAERALIAAQHEKLRKITID